MSNQRSYYPGQSQQTQEIQSVNQSELKTNTGSRHQARENAIGFGSTSDWFRKRREIFKPITKHSNVKESNREINFDT